jgi:hypothetical protein
VTGRFKAALLDFQGDLSEHSRKVVTDLSSKFLDEFASNFLKDLASALGELDSSALN